MQIIKKIFSLLNKQQKWQLTGLFILIVIGSMLELLGVSAILPLINLILSPDSAFENEIIQRVAASFNLTDVIDIIVLYAGVLAILYVIKNIFLLVSKRMQLYLTHNIQKDVAMRLMDGYLHQNYLFHVSHNVAELQRNIVSDVKQYTITLIMMINLAIECVTCLMLLIFLLVTDIVTTVLVAGILLLATFIFMRIYKKLQVRYGIINRKMGEQLNKWLLQSFGGIKEIKVMNREDFFLKNYDRAYQRSVEANVNSNIISSLPKYIMETICMCGLLLVIIIRVLQGEALDEFAEVLMVFAVAAIRMLPAFNRITEYFGNLLFNKAGVDSLCSDLIKLEKDRKSENDLNDGERIELQKVIQIKNITFRYPNTETKIFDDASLEISKNKSIAFVGSSGAGKTTLADIVIGVLKPESGDVLVDGRSIYGNLDAWHKSIGYIPQVIYLMDDSIRANIVFGMPEKDVDDEKVWKALERAELADFVRGLKDGLNTEVGDRGVRLSGGQRQRIGIARALYTEPDVLILDEATSALDNETEAAVMDSIEHLQGQTTMIIIAHRLTTIKNCDEVYEVEKGAIRRKELAE